VTGCGQTNAKGVTIQQPKLKKNLGSATGFESTLLRARNRRRVGDVKCQDLPLVVFMRQSPAQTRIAVAGDRIERS
jgi:hypothetical protein